MKRIRYWKSRSFVLAVVGLTATRCIIPARADAELNAAADRLAKAGEEFLRSTGAAPIRGASQPAVNNALAKGPASAGGAGASEGEAPFEGVFVGTVGEGIDELRARFAAGKVEWVEPGKRSWNTKVTNSFTFTLAAGRLTLARAGLPPLIYRTGEGRKSLTLESGDGRMVPKELKAARP